MSTTRDKKPAQPESAGEESAARPEETAESAQSPAAAEEDRQETREWLDSLDYIYQTDGPERVRELLQRLEDRATSYGVRIHFPGNTPYINTIPLSKQPAYPGDRAIERRLKSYMRWNAMAMVVRANREDAGIGGHISTYASAATLYEVGFNHFFRGKDHPDGSDIIYYQGHAAPGIYARAYLEGRLTEKHLENFRHELPGQGGLSSYPHPWLMPEFWEFPTVSMGLTPLLAIYQARFNRYLEHRGILDTSKRMVWAFLGDGEMDEPEALGAITLASRERLDNVVFVINCNLQRLDGPVRGNGKIIQELGAAFRGAGWNVIKLITGGDWDSMLAQDKDGVLVQRLTEVVDGQFQKYATESGEYIRKDFFGADPRLLKMVEHLSDDQLRSLRRGGHDPDKVYAAYKAAVEHNGQPTVILAWTIKGYGLGEAGEGRNITHQQKKLNEDELRAFRNKFGIPIDDEDVARAPFYKPPADSEDLKYLHERRQALGGSVPERREQATQLQTPPASIFDDMYAGSGEREVATTMAFVQMLTTLLKDKSIGQHVVPIVPDEARTFGMESLFRQVGIYSSLGQLYDPVDRETLLYYKEAVNGQILEEGITEAGSTASFVAAGTAYATHGINMIPFFIFYSMFGFQRIGDFIWAAGDMRCKGFLLGGTSGRTTLAGEGLQHQDGHSHVLALTHPRVRAYDPTFAYELAVILHDGIERMYKHDEKLIYYITVMNETYRMPPMPEGCREGILRGVYRFKASDRPDAKNKVNLFGSGAILNEVLRAQRILEDAYDVPVDVYSVTSYSELYRDAVECERWNLLHPGEEARVPYVGQVLKGTKGVYVAASDYMKVLPASIASWVPGHLDFLGTDGFGRSSNRAGLRDFFEVDARYIALAALRALARDGHVKKSVVKDAVQDLGIDPDKANPHRD
ncbi:MAG TPA: pyruvate dehydrogenase (acetyl-transferring), homodimeric type [Candidatus Krumholzibacteria bacterium]|nr:pyruvate dehydrogenase (acetyl-transferring), homodimeric type [Candidatus Krumholzibacteria bacterium]